MKKQNQKTQGCLHQVLLLAASARSVFISALAVASLQSTRKKHTKEEESWTYQVEAEAAN